MGFSSPGLKPIRNCVKITDDFVILDLLGNNFISYGMPIVGRGRQHTGKFNWIYSRPKTGTGMPKKERFRHAQFGRASSSVLLSKLPVLSWTAAEAANWLLCGFWSGFLTDDAIKPPMPGGDNPVLQAPVRACARRKSIFEFLWTTRISRDFPA